MCQLCLLGVYWLSVDLMGGVLWLWMHMMKVYWFSCLCRNVEPMWGCII